MATEWMTDDVHVKKRVRHTALSGSWKKLRKLEFVLENKRIPGEELVLKMALFFQDILEFFT